jgi:hypothetical protein
VHYHYAIPAHHLGQTVRALAAQAALAGWWRELDSNQRTLGGQIYSLVDLTTLLSLHGTRANAV